jgi:hypothetical protein
VVRISRARRPLRQVARASRLARSYGSLWRVGGVNSSVAASHRYLTPARVVGLPWLCDQREGIERSGLLRSPEDLYGTRRVAASLGIHLSSSISGKEFDDTIIRNFVDEYDWTDAVRTHAAQISSSRRPRQAHRDSGQRGSNRTLRAGRIR